MFCTGGETGLVVFVLVVVALEELELEEAVWFALEVWLAGGVTAGGGVAVVADRTFTIANPFASPVPWARTANSPAAAAGIRTWPLNPPRLFDLTTLLKSAIPACGEVTLLKVEFCPTGPEVLAIVTEQL